MDSQKITLDINGEEKTLYITPNETLLDVLRDKVQIYSPKKSCERGQCGACTVLLDGEPVTACLVLAATVDGSKITTVEGIGLPGSMHPVQEAFYEHGASQCGYCTPGMVLAAKALLDKNPAPSMEEIKRGLSGNLCRCTGYIKIIEAVRLAAEKTQSRGGRDG